MKIVRDSVPCMGLAGVDESMGEGAADFPAECHSGPAKVGGINLSGSELYKGKKKNNLKVTCHVYFPLPF